MRTRLSLDGQWYFSPTEILNNDNGSLISVPSPWQADARFRDHIGTAWYQREFEVPTEWIEQNHVVILDSGGGITLPEAWLKMVKVAEQEVGTFPFRWILTKPGTVAAITLP